MAIYETYAHGMPNWVDLMATDGEQAAAWYGDLFGWKAEKQMSPAGPYWMFTLDGQNVAGMGEMSAEMKASGMPPVWNAYFSVTDVEEAVAACERLGGRTMFPVHDIPGAGRMAFVTDPEGAVFGLWQDMGHCGATLVNVPNTWCWNEHDARDVASACEFYSALLGWNVTDGDNGIKMYHVGEAPVAHGMTIQPEWGEMPPMWTVYFAVADTDEVCARVQASGGTVIMPGMDIPVGRFALLKDPQGGMFYVIKLNNPA